MTVLARCRISRRLRGMAGAELAAMADRRNPMLRAKPSSFSRLLMLHGRLLQRCTGRNSRHALRLGFFNVFGQRAFESDRQNVVHGLSEVELHGVAQVLRDF